MKLYWKPINSSMANAVAINGADLYVQFAKGKVYRYIGAAFHLDALLQAESAGQYINMMVKPTFTAELVE